MEINLLINKAIESLDLNRPAEALAYLVQTKSCSTPLRDLNLVWAMYWAKAGDAAQARSCAEEELRLFPDNLVALEFISEVVPSAEIKAGAPQPQPAAAKPAADVQSLLWLRTDSLSGNLISAGMLPSLRRHYAHARITVVCQKQIVELYETCPLVNDVISYDQDLLAADEAYRLNLLQQLQAARAELLLNSAYSRDPISDLLAANSGAAEKTALCGDRSTCDDAQQALVDPHYTRLIDSPGPRRTELERQADFLGALGVPFSHLSPAVWTTSEDAAFADGICQANDLQKDQTIALAAGMQRQIKEYPCFAEALAPICRAHNFNVVALGDDREWGQAQSCLAPLGIRTLNLCGKMTLRQTAALLRRLRLVVCTESAVSHLACAVGTPQMLVLGGGRFGRFHPYSRLSSIVCLPLNCYQCGWQCRYSTPYCVRAIRPEVLSLALQQTLTGHAGKPRVFVQGASLWPSKADEPLWQSPAGLIAPESAELLVLEQSGVK